MHNVDSPAELVSAVVRYVDYDFVHLALVEMEGAKSVIHTKTFCEKFAFIPVIQVSKGTTVLTARSVK